MLEYASCVWDPYLVKDISNPPKMVQRRAAWWVDACLLNASVSHSKLLRVDEICILILLHQS